MRKTVSVLVLLLSLAGCSHSEHTFRKVTVAQFGAFFLYAPLYVGIDAGFFAQQGLSISLVSTGGDETTWATVLSGQAQFGVADPTFVAIAGARGQPGKVVAALVNGVPFWGVAIDSSVHEITNPSELAGHTVATFPSPSTAYALQRDMFAAGDVPPSIREGPPGTLLALLKSHQADIALLLEPTVSQAVAEGGHVVYSMAGAFGSFAITGLTTRPSMIRDDPALVQKMTCGLQHAMALIYANPDSAVTLLAERFPDVPRAVARAALDRAVAAGVIPKNGVISEDAWKNAVKVRREVGDLSSPAPFATYVDTTFAARAATLCGGA